MILKDNWFSAAAEADNGAPIFINGRLDLEAFKNSGKFNERVEIYWHYEKGFNEMPHDEEGLRMEEVLECLKKAMEKDKLAILTGIYTGNGERTLVFYTRTSHVFGERLNEALAPFELLPIELYVEIDKDWNEYNEMLEAQEYGE